MTNHTYQGHRADGGGLQRHSIGATYPYGIMGLGSNWVVTNFETGYALSDRGSIIRAAKINDAQLLLSLVSTPSVVLEWLPLIVPEFTAGGVKTLFSKD